MVSCYDTVKCSKSWFLLNIDPTFQISFGPFSWNCVAYLNAHTFSFMNGNPLASRRSISHTLLPPSVTCTLSIQSNPSACVPAEELHRGPVKTLSIGQQVTAKFIRTLLISPSNFNLSLQGIRWILLICGNIKNLCFPTCSSSDTNITGYFSRVLVVCFFFFVLNGDESHTKVVTNLD